MLQFGKRHLKRLQAKELFPYGLPLETTLCRVFQSIDNEKMADRMSAFAEVFRRDSIKTATPTDVYKNSILAHAALACVEALYAQFKT